MSYHIIIQLRCFDKTLWEEFDVQEKPLLIYNIKQRLRWKLMSTLDQQGNVIKPKKDDKTFMELKFWEISVDKKGSWCWVVKYIWASENAYPEKKRYLSYGTQFNKKKEKLNVVRTDQII